MVKYLFKIYDFEIIRVPANKLAAIGARIYNVESIFQPVGHREETKTLINKDCKFKDTFFSFLYKLNPRRSSLFLFTFASLYSHAMIYHSCFNHHATALLHGILNTQKAINFSLVLMWYVIREYTLPFVRLFGSSGYTTLLPTYIHRVRWWTDYGTDESIVELKMKSKN